jgi:hypothetical protein
MENIQLDGKLAILEPQTKADMVSNSKLTFDKSRLYELALFYYKFINNIKIFLFTKLTYHLFLYHLSIRKMYEILSLFLSS